MYQVLKDFFVDGATFKRAVSDVMTFAGAAAVTPGIAPAVASLFPGAGWIAPVALLAGAFYSARSRQLQTPP